MTTRKNQMIRLKRDPRLAITCGAGDSIKPGAQAPGSSQITIEAREASDRCAMGNAWLDISCRPLCGLGSLGDILPGAYAPGFMLTPAGAGSTQVGEVSSHA